MLKVHVSNSANPTPTAHFSLHVPSGKDSQSARERHSSTGKENVLNSPTSAEVNTNAVRHETPNAKLHKAMDVYNFEMTTPKKDEPETGDVMDIMDIQNIGSPSGRVRAALFAGVQQSARMQNVSEDLNLFQDTELSDDEDGRSSRCDVFQKPHDPAYKLMNRDVAGTSRSLSGLTLIPPDNVPIGKNFAFSPGCSKFEQATGSSTCSSCVSSPIILQSESQCFTYSVRRYIEPYGRPESPTIDVEGMSYFAPYSVLFLTFVKLEVLACSGGSRISRRGGRGPRRRGCGLPRWLHFENFVCQNERIGTLRGGHAPGAPPPRSANGMSRHPFKYSRTCHIRHLEILNQKYRMRQGLFCYAI